jgi:hypothetical protein
MNTNLNTPIPAARGISGEGWAAIAGALGSAFLLAKKLLGPKAAKPELDSSDLRHFAAVEKYIAFRDRPDRAAWQKPDEVVTALALQGDETVFDLGAGPQDTSASNWPRRCRGERR